MPNVPTYRYISVIIIKCSVYSIAKNISVFFFIIWKWPRFSQKHIFTFIIYTYCYTRFIYRIMLSWEAYMDVFCVAIILHWHDSRSMPSSISTSHTYILIRIVREKLNRFIIILLCVYCYLFVWHYRKQCSIFVHYTYYIIVIIYTTYTDILFI